MSAAIPLVSVLSKRIIRILGCNPGPMTLQGTNTYLIGTGRRRILVDTGEAGRDEYVRALSGVLSERQISLESVIITHWHGDHIGGLPHVMAFQPSDCKVWKFKRGDEQNKGNYEGIHMNYLTDGQEIFTEGATLRVIHTPGHTSDHVCLLLKEETALLSGDTVLGEGTAVFEDLSDYMGSLSKLLSLRPSVIYPGHGPIVLDPVDKIQYYIDHRNKREEEIIDILKSASQPVDVTAIVKLLYSDKSEYLQKMAAHNVSHHLTKLVKDDKVEMLPNGTWHLHKE